MKRRRSLHRQSRDFEPDDVWTSEQVYFEGDEYFGDILQAVALAKRSVDVEFYIYQKDELGSRLLDALIAASERGVRVRIVVDSIGSLTSKFWLKQQFANTAVAFQIYHELPWERSTSDHPLDLRSLSIFSVLRRTNRRTHRKYVIIDDRQVFAGGMNVSTVSLREFYSEHAWRDTGVRVEGNGVQDFVLAFERLWLRRHPIRAKQLGGRLMYPFLVRLNYSRSLRRQIAIDLLLRIRTARTRILITNAYFVPHRRVLRALAEAAGRGVDVQIIVPERSDVFFVPWVALRYILKLTKAGAKVFEYSSRMLHAKSMIIDDWYVVGTANLNHRSLLHDLEVDVIMHKQESQTALLAQFEADRANAHSVGNTAAERLTFAQRLFVRIALLFERYL